MFKIIFNNKSTLKIEDYINSYKLYYFEAYKDSGIWSHKEIIERYIEEGDSRLDEIYETIQNKLSSEIISYSNNEIVIRWRTKILLVQFSEAWDTRTIIDLDIR